MPLNFPNSPAIGEQYAFGDFTWQWNNDGWVQLPYGGRVGPWGTLIWVVTQQSQDENAGNDILGTWGQWQTVNWV